MITPKIFTRDLGTYYVRVKLTDGTGFITDWHTSARFVGGGTEHFSPLTAQREAPLYTSEEDLFQNIEFMFIDGNFSCDCNLKSFVDRATNGGKYEFGKYDCGDTLKIESIIAICPNGEEKVIVGGL